MGDFIKAGDNIVLDINSSKFAFIKLRNDGTVKIAGHTCSSEPLLGARFGSAFLLDEDKCLSPTDVDPHAFISSTSTTERVRLPQHSRRPRLVFSCSPSASAQAWH